MKKIVLSTGIILTLGVGGFFAYRQVVKNEPVKVNSTSSTVLNVTNESASNTPTENINMQLTNASVLELPIPLVAWNPELSKHVLGDGFSTYFEENIPADQKVGAATCEAEQSSDIKAHCYQGLAIGFRDPRYCEKYVNHAGETNDENQGGSDTNCIQAYTLEYGNYDCSFHIDQDVQDVCYYIFAVPGYILSPTKDCSLLQDAVLKKNCNDQIAIYDRDHQLLQDSNAVVCLLVQDQAYLKYFSTDYVSEDYKKRGASKLASDQCADLSKAEISTKDRAKTVVTTDQDADGLNSFVERIYGSDDTKTDTDGDGFKDLQEVLGEYSPTGPGKLEFTR